MYISINEFRKYLISENLIDSAVPGEGSPSPVREINPNSLHTRRINNIKQLQPGVVYRYEFWKSGKVEFIEFERVNDDNYIMDGSIAIFKNIYTDQLFELTEDEIRSGKLGALYPKVEK